MSDLESKLSSLDLTRPAAVTIGTFDGVHLGHQRLLGLLRDEASANQLTSVAIAFAAQPRSIIDPATSVSYLTTLKHRLELLESTGVDLVSTVAFDEALRALTAFEFLTMLRNVADVRMLVAGPGARLGSDRRPVNEIVGPADGLGMNVIEAPRVAVNGHDVSSSAIRKSLAAGDVVRAAGMLGRSYSVEGKVVQGDKRGRELGFPTANIEPDDQVAVPSNGIYATVIIVDGLRHRAATSIGVRPTFGGGERTIEAFILDFDTDIYGRNVQLEFRERLRAEMKFDGPEPLVEQMNRDVSETRKVLSDAI